MKDLSTFDEWILADDFRYEIIERIESALPIKWPYEYAILYLAKFNTEVSVDNVVDWLIRRFDFEIKREQHEHTNFACYGSIIKNI